jgi:hypothetical protein
MADEDFEDEDIELDADEELDDDLVIDDDAEADIDVLDADPAADVVDDDVVEPEVPATRARRGSSTDDDSSEDEEDDVVDLEEEHHPDDVEDPLDVLLKERTSAERLDEDEADVDDEELEPDERTDGSGKVVPRREDEFLCRSCFLVKPLSQLAKGEKDLCRDCE